MKTKCSAASTTISMVVPPSVTGRKLTETAVMNNRAKSGSGSTAWKLPVEFHRDVLPAGVGVTFVRDLQVATDPLDTSVEGERGFESGREDEERDERADGDRDDS